LGGYTTPKVKEVPIVSPAPALTTKPKGDVANCPFAALAASGMAMPEDHPVLKSKNAEVASKAQPKHKPAAKPSGKLSAQMTLSRLQDFSTLSLAMLAAGVFLVPLAWLMAQDL